LKTPLKILNPDKINDKLSSLSLDNRLQCYYSDFTIFVINTADNKIINKIPTHENITSLSFDLSSSYIVAGSQNGRVLQYKYNSDLLLSRLCSFNSKQQSTIKQDFSAVFSFFNNKIACGGNRGEIVVMDLYSQSNKEIFTCGKSRITTLSFLDNETLTFGNEDGFVHILYLNKRISKEINTPFRTIKQLLHVKSSNQLIIHENTTSIALIDTQKCKVSSNNYINFKIDIQSVNILNSELLEVRLNNNTSQHVKFSNIENLKSLILHNSIYEAYRHIDKEPMLIYTSEYKELENKFNEIYQSAIEALIKNDKNLLLQIIDSFIDIPSKKDTIRLLLKAFDNYERFKTLYIEKSHHIAYAMSLKFPALQKTPEYLKMEEEWKEVLKKAQKYLLQSDRDNAKEILNRYITVNTKREIIKLVLKDNRLFIDFLKANEQKNLKKAYEISSKNISFTRLPTYKQLNAQVEAIVKDIKYNIKKGYIDLAKESLQKLCDIEHLKSDIKKLERECNNTLLLQEAYVKKDFKLCYETLDLYPYLKSTDIGLLLEENYAQLMYECEEFALSGNVKDIKLALGRLLELESRKGKIGDLLRVGFHAKISMLIEKKELNSAENIIYSYMDIFGTDNEIEYIIKVYELNSPRKLAISQNQNRRVARDSWKNSELIMS